ncbi:MAG: LamB/YcsF family protein [Planctomycetes bacterium]|nr:LamB/YcsF family protein [Planctomycetota bacterium]
MTECIDLNCDLGERCDAPGVSADLELLSAVSSANIACGGHAGDYESMIRTVAAAIELGVAVGAHPSFPDRPNFGRVTIAMPLPQLEDAIASQVDALLRIVIRQHGCLTHVKPHGALYHAAMRQAEIAEAIANAVVRLGLRLILVGQSGAIALGVWGKMGFQVAAEAFADRRYEADGSLRDRRHADAVLATSADAAQQAVRIATGAGVLTPTGSIVPVRADTICLHSDTPDAPAKARAVRDALLHAGIRMRALALSCSKPAG